MTRSIYRKPTFLHIPVVLGGQALIFDQFTGLSGALGAHTIAPINTVGASWLVVTGTFELQSNRAKCTANIVGSYARVNAGRTNARLSVITNISTASAYVRGLRVWTNYAVGLDITGQLFAIKEDLTVRASTPFACASLVDYRIAAR